MSRTRLLTDAAIDLQPFADLIVSLFSLRACLAPIPVQPHLDSIRCKEEDLRCLTAGVADCVTRMLREEGISSFFRCLRACVASCVRSCANVYGQMVGFRACALSSFLILCPCDCRSLRRCPCRGIAPRILYVSPFAAIQFAVHEAVTALLRTLDRPTVLGK